MKNVTNLSRFISLILRHKPVVLLINTYKMHADGYRFYLSANKVWLTKEVSIKYI